MIYDVTINGKSHRLELGRPDGRWQCRLDGNAVELDAVLIRPGVLSILLEGKAHEVRRDVMATGTRLWVGSMPHEAELRDPRSLRARRRGAGAEQGPQKLLATMPGKVVRILAGEKSEVEAGQGIVVVEAMKMQNEIKSPKKGIVQKLVTMVGANVNAGDVLAIVE